MKIVYYVTDHGLGHASRAIALIKEFKKKNIVVVVRSNDPLGILKKSLSDVQIISGSTDFKPVMQKNNPMRFSDIQTKKKLLDWIANLPDIITHESRLLKKILPDLIISDTAFMPLLTAKKNQIPSILISNFIWNEALNLPQHLKLFLHSSYENSDLVLKLPFGTKMNLKNKRDVGLVSRLPTISKHQIRKNFGLKKHEKLVLISLSGMLKNPIKFPKNVHVLDISDYSIIKNSEIDIFVNGQNLVNAADLVICKCGYGFVSECLTSGTKFYYVLDKKHKEANGIHRQLLKNNLKNNINITTLFKKEFTTRSMNVNSEKIPVSNKNIVNFIISFYKNFPNDIIKR